MEAKEKIIKGNLEMEFVSEYGQNYGVLNLVNSSSKEIELYKEWDDFVGENVKITIEIIR